MGDLAELLRRIEPSDAPAAIASAIEFALEGLHLNRRLNRDRAGDHYLYKG